MSNPLQGFINWLEGTSVYLTPIVTVTLTNTKVTLSDCSDYIFNTRAPSPMVYHGSAKVASGGSALSVAAVFKDLIGTPTPPGEWGFDTLLTWNGSNVELTGADFGVPGSPEWLFGDPYHFGCRLRASILRNTIVSHNGGTLELDFGAYYKSVFDPIPGSEDASCKLVLQKGYLIFDPLPIHLP
jgi:hypothetical protein